MLYNCGTVCIHGKYITKTIDKEKFLLHLLTTFNQSLVISKEYYQCNEFVVEVYLQGLTFNNIDSQFLKEVTTIFQTVYPDKLRRCIIINPPIIFRTIWDIVKMIIDNKTKEKIEISKLSQSQLENIKVEDYNM